ncbi:hypothetical protein NKH77_49525 [Streptomyces sp. M19]
MANSPRNHGAGRPEAGTGRDRRPVGQGPPGVAHRPRRVGKTRLALRAARNALPRFADGICFVELSSLRDPVLLPHTVAAALGLSEQGDRDPLGLIVAYLAGKRLLLVLDTCEHLLDACAMLADLVLRRAPG